MAKRRVPEVMTDGNGLYEVVEASAMPMVRPTRLTTCR